VAILLSAHRFWWHHRVRGGTKVVHPWCHGAFKLLNLLRDERRQAWRHRSVSGFFPIVPAILARVDVTGDKTTYIYDAFGDLLTVTAVTDRSVRMVRSFRRAKAAQTSGRYFTRRP
jgi:hypothetical protein